LRISVEDLERHDGSPEKPYYMSKGLMEILGKKNQDREHEHSTSSEKK
jgi:choline transporter-like protein 2/4/5